MHKVSRRSFVGQAVVGAAALGAVAGRADAQLVYKSSDWKLADFKRLLKDTSRVKQLFEETQIGDGRFLNNMKNSLNGLRFGFDIPADQIKLIGALHGPANTVNFDDYVWQKYRIGEWLKVNDPKTGQPAVRNIFYPAKSGQTHSASEDPSDENSSYQDASIQTLQTRGVQFLCCHTATEEQSRALIKQFGLTQQPEEIVKDQLSHIHPGVLVVPAMVSAIALLQSEGHCSYVTV
jgi:intracellular sulfur oxidation DsrE/DsrF family protein